MLPKWIVESIRDIVSDLKKIRIFVTDVYVYSRTKDFSDLYNIEIYLVSDDFGRYRVLDREEIINNIKFKRKIRLNPIKLIPMTIAEFKIRSDAIKSNLKLGEVFKKIYL